MSAYNLSYIHKGYVIETNRTHNKFDVMLPGERYAGYKVCLPCSAVKKVKDIYCLWYLKDSEFSLINVQDQSKRRGYPSKKISGQELSDILLEGATWYLTYDCEANDKSYNIYNVKSYRIGYFINEWFISDEGDIWNKSVKPSVIREINVAHLDLIRARLQELRTLNSIVNSPINELNALKEANEEYLKIVNRKFESVGEKAFISKLRRTIKRLEQLIADEYKAIVQRFEIGCRELCSGIN